MNINQKGLIGELKVAGELLLCGYEVYFPLTGTASHDMIAVKDGVCYKVQVKTTSQKSRHGNSYIVETRTVVSSKKGNTIKKLTTETIDYLAIYIIPEDTVLILKSTEVPNKNTFRVANGKLVGPNKEK